MSRICDLAAPRERPCERRTCPNLTPESPPPHESLPARCSPTRMPGVHSARTASSVSRYQRAQDARSSREIVQHLPVSSKRVQLPVAPFTAVHRSTALDASQACTELTSHHYPGASPVRAATSRQSQCVLPLSGAARRTRPGRQVRHARVRSGPVRRRCRAR